MVFCPARRFYRHLPNSNHGQYNFPPESSLPKSLFFSIDSIFKLFFSVIEFNQSLSIVTAFGSNDIETAAGKCAQWVEGERNRTDHSVCYARIQAAYGCPRLPGIAYPDGYSYHYKNDAFYAHQEVRIGGQGWNYDMCCNDNDSYVRNQLNDVNFCSNLVCEFNQGADFCITSPEIDCYDDHLNKISSISNQCCYDAKSGKLIEKSYDSKAPGSVDFKPNSIGTMIKHYKSDLQPFKDCCVDSNNCNVYKNFRPTLNGVYCPRVMTVQRGGSSFQTLDGQEYPYFGSDFYRAIEIMTLLEATWENPLRVQVITRKYVNTTFIAGILIQHGKEIAQVFQMENQKLLIAINDKDNVISFELLKKYQNIRKGNIQLIAKDGEMTIKMQNGFAVRILFSFSSLTLFVSVPTYFKGTTQGLMGDYDGDPSNDFLANGELHQNQPIENWLLIRFPALHCFMGLHTYMKVLGASYVSTFLLLSQIWMGILRALKSIIVEKWLKN